MTKNKLSKKELFIFKVQTYERLLASASSRKMLGYGSLFGGFFFLFAKYPNKYSISIFFIIFGIFCLLIGYSDKKKAIEIYKDITKK